MSKECDSLSKDPIKLLYAINLYTNNKHHPWLKDFCVNVIVHVGVIGGIFEHYDLAPCLTDFRGIKMFARISQEALGDLDLLFRRNLIERLLLNTRFYAPAGAVRISDSGLLLLKESDYLSADDREDIERILKCNVCGNILDYLVWYETTPSVRLMVGKMCSCMSRGLHRTDDEWMPDDAVKSRIAIEGFFTIGNISYKGRPCFLGGQNGR